jgi:hypothetical protein
VSPCSPECLSEDARWETATGEGTIWSLAIYEHPYHQAFASQLPYVVALVELDAGPRMIANILGSIPEEVVVGARVSPALEVVTDQMTLLQFRLAQREAGVASDPMTTESDGATHHV